MKICVMLLVLLLSFNLVIAKEPATPAAGVKGLNRVACTASVQSNLQSMTRLQDKLCDENQLCIDTLAALIGFELLAGCESIIDTVYDSLIQIPGCIDSAGNSTTDSPSSMKSNTRSAEQ